jgi:hypothetical protein
MNKLLSNTFSLTRDENAQIGKVLADYGHGNEQFMRETAYGASRWNIKKVHRFFTLGTQPVHRVFNGIDGYYTVNDADTYVKRVLGFDKGLQGLRSKGRSVNEAIQTIRSVRSLINAEEGQEGISLHGFAAGIEVLKESVFGTEGFIDQMMSVISDSGAQFGNDDGTLGTRESMAAKLKERFGKISGHAGLITRREVLMELLAYQLAAAIQGGTGGRTISDQDVVNIKRALGSTLFTSGKLQKGRLAQLEAMMLDLREVTSTYTRSNTIEELKAADLTTQFLLDGRDLNSMNNAYATGEIINIRNVPEDSEAMKNKEINSEFSGYKIDALGGGIFNSLDDARSSPEGQEWIRQNTTKDFNTEFGFHFVIKPNQNKIETQKIGI